MTRDSSEKPQQNFDIRDSQIKNTQIGGQAGRDLYAILNQFLGRFIIGLFNRVTINNNNSIVSQESIETKLESRSRQNLLKEVKEVWIEGVLEKSLHKQIPIILDLEERSDAVAKFNNGEIRINPNQKAKPLNQDTKIIDIFDGKNIRQCRQILILGEPGSGKTIALLEFAKEWIDRAKNDDNCLIPVVFNLSSYKDKEQQDKKEKKEKIVDWLVEEFKTYYQTYRKDARNLIEQKKLLFLFDGLDEVDNKYRVECIEALNDFIETGSEIIICCRIKDYQALLQLLQLKTAIYLKPLTFEQIDNYLNRLGSKLIGLKTLLQKERKSNLKEKILSKDSPLNDLAKTPLMLSIMISAYEGVSREDLLKKYWLKDKEKQLFDDYIKKMFDRRCWESNPPPYSRKRLISFLTFIAKGMEKESQSIFLIERIQPSYLNKKELILYKIAVGIFLFIIIFLTTFWGMKGHILIAIFFGIAGFGFGIKPKLIKPIVKLKWNWKQVIKVFGLPILLLSFFSFFFFGLALALVAQKPWIMWGILGLIMATAFLGLIIDGSNLFLTGIFDKNSQENSENTTHPNEEIWKSVKNSGIIIIRMLGWIFILAVSLILFQVHKFDLTWLSSMGRFAFSLGVIFSLINGSGLAVIQHLFLRSILWFKYKTPWSYTKLLDYATERIFRQKVGGGYIFIHPMLREHFAKIESVDRLLKYKKKPPEV